MKVDFRKWQNVNKSVRQNVNKSVTKRNIVVITERLQIASTWTQ